jgi:hypothetical protein
MLRLARAAGEGDHGPDAGIGGQSDCPPKRAVCFRCDRRVGVKRIAVAGEPRNLESALAGAFHEPRLVVRTGRRDLDRLAAGSLRGLQRQREDHGEALDVVRRGAPAPNYRPTFRGSTGARGSPLREPRRREEE